MINIDKTEGKKDTEELISKKDLLSLTKISYGQLYRWKRMNIIPEDWFIKKSTPTGQETFFKRDKILERIQIILSMKDDISLEEIAEVFNKKEDEKAFDLSYVIEKGVISKGAGEAFMSLQSEKKVLNREELIDLAIIEKYLLKSAITFDEMKMVIESMEEAVKKLYNQEGRLVLYRKFGVPFIMGYNNSSEILVDAKAVKIMEVDLIKEFSEMNRKLI